MEKLFEHDVIARVNAKCVVSWSFAPYFKIVQFLKFCSKHFYKKKIMFI
jgi:hypothetical protein